MYFLVHTMRQNEGFMIARRKYSFDAKRVECFLLFRKVRFRQTKPLNGNAARIGNKGFFIAVMRELGLNKRLQ